MDRIRRSKQEGQNKGGTILRLMQMHNHGPGKGAGGPWTTDEVVKCGMGREEQRLPAAPTPPALLVASGPKRS